MFKSRAGEIRTMNPLLFVCLVVGFFVTLFMTPLWIRAARRVGLLGKDMNKFHKPEVAEMGGIAVVAGFLAGVFVYIGLITFFFRAPDNLISILAAISTVLIVTIIGMLDDILGWKRGLKQHQKILLTIPVAIPLMAVNAGESITYVPLLGMVDLGMIYPLLIIPVGIIGASNAFNLLAGYNGLEAGMGALILGALGLAAWQTGQGYVALLAAVGVFALLAFLFFNWFPAVVFPGDTLTYFIGALIACIAILGDLTRVALFLFIPYFMEFILKARGGFRKESFARPLGDNTLQPPYERAYGLEHLAIRAVRRIKGRCFERDATVFILGIEAVLILMACLLWIF